LEKNMKLVKTVGALALAGFAAVGGQAAVAAESGGYIGLGVGLSQANIADNRIRSQLQGSWGLTMTTIDDDDRDVGYKLYGGYKFNKNFAVEGGYFNLGKFGFTANTATPGSSLTGSGKFQGLNLDLVGILPFTEKFSAFGRAGFIYAEAKDTFSGTGAVTVNTPNPEKKEGSYKYGLGLQYDLTRSLGLRAEWERYRVNDAVGNKGDIDMALIGLVYTFGAGKPAPKAATPPPAYVAPVAAAPVAAAPVAAPPPPPPPRAVTPPPAPRKVTFSADSLFDFDKAIVKPAGKQALDRLAADLRGANFDVITVTGYTDRIGSHAYNMKLSTHRAEAIKTNLVESAGIPAGKIAARGRGGSDPVTRPGQCKGTKATQALIACLQPDRRVEVEVSGTR